MKRIIQFIIILSFLSNCEQNESASNRTQVSKSEWRHKVISTEEAKNEFKNSNIKVQNLFNHNSSTDLNSDEIFSIYSILGESIRNYNIKNKRDIKFNNYRFYIVPTLNQSNEKIVFITAYCFDIGDEWEDFTYYYNVRDGGDCFFRTTFRVILNGHQKMPTIMPNGEV